MIPSRFSSLRRFVDSDHASTRALAIVVVMSLAVLTTLASEAWRSERAQQANATRALREYARFAAVTYRQRVLARLYAAIVPIMRPIADARSGQRGAVLPDASDLRALAEQAIACACGPALQPTSYFRVTLSDRAVSVLGESPSSRELAMLRGLPDSLGSLLRATTWEYATIRDVSDDAPRIVVVGLRRGPDQAPRAIYGFRVALASFNNTIFREVLEGPSLLQLTPAEQVPNDSLMSVSIRAAVEPDYRASSVDYASQFEISIPFTAVPGFSSIDVTLNPTLAPELLIGGMPPSRAPLVVALVALGVVLLVATLLLAWRATTLARVRSEFVANVSHELRTPLAQVLLFGETLSLGRMTTRREVRRAADIIVGETRRLMQLVDNVLAFGRRGRRSVSRLEPVALAPLVRDVVASFAPLANTADATLQTTRLDDCAVVANRDELRQVMLNLLDNAVKYGPRGQIVTIGLASRFAQARVWVEDEGAGIPPADRERVWQPFVRLSTDMQAEAAGSGIGLAAVREIVSRHGGRTRIEDGASGGARIVIELPCVAASEVVA